MNENDLSKVILDAAFRIHTKLGPGLLESFYEAVLAYELNKRGVAVRRQVPIPIRYEELVFEEGFRADLLVEDKVIVELKSVEQFAPVHGKQVLTQLRLSGRRLGLLINFGEIHLKNGIERVANGMPDEECGRQAHTKDATENRGAQGRTKQPWISWQPLRPWREAKK
jgi:GxxExxY protein